MARTDRTPREDSETQPTAPAQRGRDAARPPVPIAAAGESGLTDEDRAIAAAMLRDYGPAFERLRDL